MALPNINLKHEPEPAHYISKANDWLSASNNGENSTTLTYAALDLRYAIELQAIIYWVTLLDRKLESHDLSEIQSFKRIEKRIYQLAGHQKDINGHFEFMRIFLAEMNIDSSFITPKIGNLAKYWHSCSEICHIGWPLGSSEPNLRKTSYKTLREISDGLSKMIESMSWPILKEPNIVSLRNDFITGKKSRDDVISYIKKIGVWARIEYQDDRPPEFIGDPVPPNQMD